MNITLRMAWRNLWRHKRRTWLTVGAMIFSNFLLVFMITIQFGSYQMMIDNTLKPYTGHMQVQNVKYLDNTKIRYDIPDVLKLAETLRQELNTGEISARAEAFVMASSNLRSYGLQIIGVDPTHEPTVSSLPGLVKRGRYFSDHDVEEIIVGATLARNLKVEIGDEITLLGSGRDGSFAAGIVKIVGIFDSGFSEVDRHMAQIPIGYFQTLFNMHDGGHNIVINTDGLTSVDEMASRIKHLIRGNQDLTVRDWDSLQPGLKQAIQADMTSGFFMYAILIILVAFSVLNTQLMSVLERTHEFGTMMALGVQPFRLSRLIITETFFMSSIGLIIGTALGGALAYYLSIDGFSYPGMEDMADRFNLPSKIYPSVSFLSLILGPIVVFLSSLLSSIYPASRLLFFKPLEAMRSL